jgi:adenylate kinase
MNIALIGPSGAGKGTQIDRLISRFGLVHFCPGNLFREHIKKRTALGILSQKYISRAQLVPDDVVDAMVEEWLWLTDPNQGVVFDGFPRTADQAIFLEKVFKEVGRELDAVILMNASVELVLKRLTGRRLCTVCHEQFHDTTAPFRTCPYDKCKGEHLHQRDEDKPESIIARHKAFEADLKLLIERYQGSRKFIQIDATGDADQIHEGIVAMLTL